MFIRTRSTLGSIGSFAVNLTLLPALLLGLTLGASDARAAG